MSNDLRLSSDRHRAGPNWAPWLAAVLGTIAVFLVAPTRPRADRPRPAKLRTTPELNVTPVVAAEKARNFEPGPTADFSGDDLRARWNTLRSLPATISRDGELAELLEFAAGTDENTGAELLRELDDTDRRRVVAAVLLDVASRPARASRLADRFVRIDPTSAAEHGYALVGVLTRAGEFETALAFVEGQHLRTSEAEEPSKWLDRLFRTWTEQQPELAAARATLLVPASLRGEALHAVAATWRRRDASAFAAFLARLPPGPERDALQEGTGVE